MVRADESKLHECLLQFGRLAVASLQQGVPDWVATWQAWLQEEWETQLGVVCWSLKEGGFSLPELFLMCPDSSLTANVWEMDGLIRDMWGPINRMYAKAPLPCAVAFVAKYGHLLHRVPILAKPLTGDYVRRRLRAMRPLAMGLDW